MNMTRKTWHSFFVASTMLGLSLTAHAAQAETRSELKPGRISVSATASAALAPDMAIMDLTVLREAKTAADALSANNAAMAAVLKSLTDAGIEKRDLQTSNFNIQPRYFYPKTSSNSRQKPPRIVGYEVRNGLTVRLRNLDKLGVVLDRTVRLGVNSGGQVRFVNENTDAALEQARKQAVEKAISKATLLANSAGVALGRVLQISESGNRQPRPIRQMARMKSAAMESAVPVAAGENNYSVTVNMQWELDQ